MKKLQNTIFKVIVALVVTITVLAAIAMVFGSPSQSVGAEALLEWVSDILKFVVLAGLVGGASVLAK